MLSVWRTFYVVSKYRWTHDVKPRRAFRLVLLRLDFALTTQFPTSKTIALKAFHFARFHLPMDSSYCCGWRDKYIRHRQISLKLNWCYRSIIRGCHQRLNLKPICGPHPQNTGLRSWRCNCQVIIFLLPEHSPLTSLIINDVKWTCSGGNLAPNHWPLIYRVFHNCWNKAIGQKSRILNDTTMMITFIERWKDNIL